MKQDYRNVILAQCDFAKMMLMLCVIACHSCAFWTGRWFNYIHPVKENLFIGILADWFGSFQIPAFVLISGFIYSYIINVRKGYKDSSHFVKTKAKRLLVPYIFVCSVWLIPIHSILHGISANMLLSRYIIGGGEQLWFLYMLFNVFLIFHFGYRYISRNVFVESITMATLYLCGFMFIRSNFNYFQIGESLKYLLFFWIGYRLWMCDNIGLIHNNYILCILLCIHIGLYIVYVIPSVPYKAINYFILNLIGSLTAFGCFTKMGRVIQSRNKIINVIQSNNFVMYLFHQQIIYFSLIYLNGVANPSLNALVNFILAFSGSLIISIVLHKNRYIRMVLGE